MQQHPEQTNLQRGRRTQPIAPGATIPAWSDAGSISQVPTQPEASGLSVDEQEEGGGAPRFGGSGRKKGRGAVWQLGILGVILAIVYLGLWPLFAGEGGVGGGNGGGSHDALYQIWIGQWLWLPRLYWTNLFPGLADILARVNWLNIMDAGGRANVVLILLGLACVLSLVAVGIGNRAVKRHLSWGDERLLFWGVWMLTVLLGATMLLAPLTIGGMTRDMLLSGLYGRMVAIFHVNPYVSDPARFSHDVMQTMLSTSKAVAGGDVPAAAEMPYGPLWLDMSVLAALFSGGSVAGTIFGLRLIGLLAHLLNVALLGRILTRIKPEMRIGGMVLYAWNPLVLVLGIAQMHQELVAVSALLLAILFLQRHSPLLSWLFALVSALLSVFCILLLPLWLRLVIKRTGGKISFWLGFPVITAIVLVLSYLPYWQEWGAMGIAGQLLHNFWQGDALNSLPAVVLNLPVQVPSSWLWLGVPAHWNIVAAIIVGVFLLFSLWLANTLELTLVCASWLALLLALLLPEYWPWYIFLPLALAICSTNRNTLLLAIILGLGALFCYYFWWLDPVWKGVGLAALGLPLLIWGWAWFLISTWGMTHANTPALAEERPRRFSRFSRPSWLSRPSRPAWMSRPSRPGRYE